MTAPRNEHANDHQDLVSLYLLQALPAGERREAADTIAACAECRDEVETLRPIIEAFVSWPTDVLRPPTALWERLAQRIPVDAGAAAAPESPTVAAADWEEAAPGISYKVLERDTERQRVSMLVRLAPGVAYPPHRHAGLEELFLLDGELFIDGRKLYPGDYNRSEAGTGDQHVWSETGCTCVLVTSTQDILQ
jgi:hypothetical protein